MKAHRTGAALQPGQLAVGGADDTVADEAGLHTLKLLREGGGGAQIVITGRFSPGGEGRGGGREGGEAWIAIFGLEPPPGKLSGLHARRPLHLIHVLAFHTLSTLSPNPPHLIHVLLPQLYSIRNAAVLIPQEGRDGEKPLAQLGVIDAHLASAGGGGSGGGDKAQGVRVGPGRTACPAPRQSLPRPTTSKPMQACLGTMRSPHKNTDTPHLPTPHTSIPHLPALHLCRPQGCAQGQPHDQLQARTILHLHGTGGGGGEEKGIKHRGGEAWGGGRKGGPLSLFTGIKHSAPPPPRLATNINIAHWEPSPAIPPVSCRPSRHRPRSPPPSVAPS